MAEFKNNHIDALPDEPLNVLGYYNPSPAGFGFLQVIAELPESGNQVIIDPLQQTVKPYSSEKFDEIRKNRDQFISPAAGTTYNKNEFVYMSGSSQIFKGTAKPLSNLMKSYANTANQITGEEKSIMLQSGAVLKSLASHNNGPKQVL